MKFAKPPAGHPQLREGNGGRETRKIAIHPPRRFNGVITNDGSGAFGALPAVETERPLWVSKAALYP
jgi:hypothetical protein